MIEHMNYEGIVPSGVEVVRETTLLRIRFDWEKVDHEATEDRDAYSELICHLVDTKAADYGGIVSAIITDKFPEDAYQAILANYELAKDKNSGITPEKKEEYLEEYNAFQAWRAKAKAVANQVLEIIS